MNFINEQYVFWFQAREQTRQISWFFNHRSGGFFDIYTKLVCNDAREGGLTQTGRTMKKRMIQRFATKLRRLDKNFQILNNLRLAGKSFHITGPYAVFKFFFRSGKRFFY